MANSKKKTTGEENLIPFNKLTEEEQRAIARKGGKASVEARRKKKDLLSAASLLMEMDVADSQKTTRKLMESLGIDEENMQYSMSIVVAMLAKASKGDVPAAKFFLEVMRLQSEKERVSSESSTDGFSLANTIEDAYKERIKKEAKKKETNKKKSATSKTSTKKKVTKKKC